MNKYIYFLMAMSIAMVSSCKETLVSQPDEIISSSASVAGGTIVGSTSTINVFDNILFYTGYDATSTAAVPEGVQRINNALYVKKLSDTDLASVGDDLKMDITIKASCDNYDRIGRVYLSLVKKGTAYSEAAAKSIEVGRFITPFMDRNKSPNEVPYSFNVSNLSQLLRDATIREAYDVWVGFSVFGVSYAAQTEVTGCKDSNATFYGTLKFRSTPSSTMPVQSVNFYSLSYMKMAGDGNDNELNYLNKTSAGAEKIINFTLDKEVKGAKLYLITSNHGANSGGEEYVRRVHDVYFDNQLKLTYTPGGKSCEPFRQYNTQGNGIYGPSPKTTANWISWNNWCPGDIIPIREIQLGDLTAGNHSFKIVVKNATFAGNSGYIPIAAYLQGTN